MTEINKRAEIDIVRTGRETVVRIPLVDQPGQEWCQRYQELAQAKNVPARAEQTPQHTWIVVNLPGYTDPSGATAQLDAARDLIEAADAAGQAADTGEVEKAAREWWSQQRG